MREIITERLLLRPFTEDDLGDLFGFLSQLENGEFERCPGITFESSREHLQYRLGHEKKKTARRHLCSPGGLEF